jgi:protoporphyrinogen/coproporphyrinogen III oxidase
MKKIVIVGAGISGLAAAWFLKKKYQGNIDLTLIEKSGRVGGWISTVHKQGFVFEAGPRGFRPTGKGETTLALAGELGLEKRLVGSSKTARRRYICLGGKLRPFSLGFLLRQGILGGALHDLVTPACATEDETIADFTTRRFNRRLAEHLMDPLTKGVFGGDFCKLSVRSCFPLLWGFERKQGSVIRGFLGMKRAKNPVSLYTFKGGMQTLPQTLAEQLDCRIHLCKTVDTLHELEADYVVCAIPTSALAPLVQQEDPLEYATLATVSLGWQERVLQKRGYGFLVPSREKGEILGMTWDSEIFPGLNQKAKTRISVMIAGNHSEEELYARALNSLKTYLGITEAPAAFYIHIATHAIPQYTLYHHQRIEAFKKRLPPNVYAIGNCFEGVGINDCIFQAKKLASDACFSP